MENKQIALGLVERGEKDPAALFDALEALRILELTGSYEVDGELLRDPENFKLAHELAKTVRSLSAKAVIRGEGAAYLDLNKRCLLFDAPYDFDAYCRYIEWNRPREKRFYEPRRKKLKLVADGLQRMVDDDLDMLGVSMPPGTGKSTIGIFYICWMAGRNPEKPILCGSHSNSFLRGVYDECLRILDPEGEYLWNDVFPDVHICGTNAKDMRRHSS